MVSVEDKGEIFTRICSLIQPTIRSCVRRYYQQLKGTGRWSYKEDEDLISEVYEHIVERGLIEGYEGRGGAGFQTYIFSVARKFLLGEIRKGKSQRVGGEEEIVPFATLEDRSLDKGIDAIPMREEEVDEGSRGEIVKAVRGCIEGLSVRERILIALFYYYRDSSSGRGMTDRDVLELLEVIDPPLTGRERPLKKVRGISTSRRRAVVRIRECLESEKFFERFGEILQLI